ncbi:hypothetical protein PV08_01301 [Exophiala spinifera]|uniref:Clr5 domain-containing protein n=1 Tax=Exophiala spinifera TaxID=91928 RepID=A0A0D2CAX2_9EURO|nr:uncharacterized protein PV08_01301 [Exophiala spinifera]KIW20724.1 hypothetical protein PV08_01301 [Exophiala spinifera]
MPPTREHPHTREEWDAIRPLFTKLYKTEGKKLSEVIEILGEKGFHAKEVHYKRRIYTWGLNKNRREWDMVIAAFIIRQRQSVGMDTMLRIRDEIITLADVQRYWKRKPYGPKDSPYFGFPEVFSEVIQYWPPALSLRSALPPPEVSFAELNQVDQDNECLYADERALMDLDGDEPCDKDGIFLPTLISGTSAKVPSTTHATVHAAQETFNFYANVYTRVGVERYREESTYALDLDNFSCTLVAHLLQRSLRPRRLQVGTSPTTPELKPMPAKWFLNVLYDNPPVLLPYLLLGLVHGITGLSIEEAAEVWRAEAGELLASIRRILGSATNSSSYSLLRMLEVLDVDNVRPFSDTISDLMPDVFKSMAIGDETILAAQLFLTLGQISKVNKSHKAAHMYLSKADRVLRLGFNRSEVTSDEDRTLTSGLHCRYYLRWLDSLPFAPAPAAAQAETIDQQALRFKIEEELHVTIVSCWHQVLKETLEELKRLKKIEKERKKGERLRKLLVILIEKDEKLKELPKILKEEKELRKLQEFLNEEEELLKKVQEILEGEELKMVRESLKREEEELKKLQENLKDYQALCDELMKFQYGELERGHQGAATGMDACPE